MQAYATELLTRSVILTRQKGAHHLRPSHRPSHLLSTDLYYNLIGVSVLLLLLLLLVATITTTQGRVRLE
jgi:hypothetical protein